MPVILKPSDYDRWLSRDDTERPPIDLLRPCDADKMTVDPADPRVGLTNTTGTVLMLALACRRPSAEQASIRTTC
jgi:putative SOS response-associated peptidase YedK